VLRTALKLTAAKYLQDDRLADQPACNLEGMQAECRVLAASILGTPTERTFEKLLQRMMRETVLFYQASLKLSTMTMLAPLQAAVRPKPSGHHASEREATVELVFCGARRVDARGRERHSCRAVEGGAALVTFFTSAERYEIGVSFKTGSNKPFWEATSHENTSSALAVHLPG